MRIRFTQTALNQLEAVKDYISKDNPEFAPKYLKKIIDRIKELKSFPYIGKVNLVHNRQDIREIIIEGFKVIYQVKKPFLYILAAYKTIDFNEEEIEIF